MGRMQENDAAAVAQVLAGDRDAFGVLVERHSQAVFSLAFRMTGNEPDAEEVVQETFMKAYLRLARFESRASFGTWLHRIAVNCALDFLARRRPGHAHTLAVDADPGKDEVLVAAQGPGPERLLLSREVEHKVSDAMAVLTRNERAAFLLRHLEGKSIDDIAAVLGIRSGAAKNCVFRAVQKMRRALETLGAPGR
jgi:RNA polymerase sigma-70 factor (ECF subfamily)